MGSMNHGTVMNKRRKKGSSKAQRKRGGVRRSPRRKQAAPSSLAADPQFTEFAHAYSGNPMLLEETIYSLPIELIDAIKMEIPDFFSKAEEAFERDLTRLSGSGFFLRRRIRHPFLPSLTTPEDVTRSAEFDRRQEQVDADLREMLTQELKRLGYPPDKTEQWFNDRVAHQQRVEGRQAGFLGWLVSNPAFGAARDRFRSAWGATIKTAGKFPAVPESFFGENPPPLPRRERPFQSDYMQFFQHWSLHSMATWDLPIPIRPEMVGHSLYHLPSIPEGGVLLFVPWYLLRDKDLKLHEAASHQQVLQGPPNLLEWILGQPEGWGHERFALMFQLYVCLELALKQRYYPRMRRKVAKLDYALARYLKPGQEAIVSVDTVRKTRQEMGRRLTR